MPDLVPPGFSGLPDFRVWHPGEWILLGMLRYTARDGRVFDVRTGYITDFASIPAPMRAVWAVNDETRLPAVVHDWCYSTQCIARAEADSLLLEMMERAGSGLAKRNAYYAGVRAGGWTHWNKRTDMGGLLPDYDFSPGWAMPLGWQADLSAVSVG